MYDNNGPQAETTAEERKPPTLADIVREKTHDGRLIIDFFIDVMEGRVEGAELCHRIDAAKQLVKYGSEDAARFIARYRGVPCGHATRGRRDPADPCSGAEDTPVAATLDAPAPFTQDLLTLLSAVDEDLMARLVRAQTADGGTVIDFLDDVMQDRNDGFKPHHRIAAAKELIVHIVRDEAPEPVPGEAPTSVHPEPNSIVVPAAGSTVIPAEAGTHPLNPEPVLSTVEGPAPVHPEPAEGARPEFTEGPADSSSVVPAKEPAEATQTFTVRQPEDDGPENNVAGKEPPGPPLSESTQGPSATTRKSRTIRPPWSSPSPSAESRKDSNSTGTSRTPMAHPSTPHPPAAHLPGDREPTTQLNSERGRGLLPPLPRRVRIESLP